MWAGTKLLVVAALGIAVVTRPSWAGQGIALGLLAIALVAARVPLTALPRVPKWFALFLGFGGVVALMAGGKPEVHFHDFALGFGGFFEWLRFTVLAVLVIAFAIVIGWTTHLADLSPALTRLLTPLRLLRFPVDELVAAVTLCVRCLPLLLDEMRTLYAVHSLRKPEVRVTLREDIAHFHDLLVGALVSALRRAREMADAIEARGGFGPAPRPPVRLGTPDAIALTTAAMAAAAIAIV
jgi:energy-coupling factor transporter transmembrane protein EcfT